jgi:membrane-associated phospholipid phosphatase
MPTMTSHSPWVLLSGLGSANVTIALALAFGLFLVTRGDYRMARWWCFLFFVTLGVVGATKLAFVGWGVAFDGLDFTGASGHAARAAAVYPVLFFILAKHHGTGMQRFALGAALFLAAAVACSRIARQVHTPSEVIAGLGIGSLAAAAYVRLAAAGEQIRSRQLAQWLGIAAVCAISLPAVPTQAWLVHAGMVLSGRQAPYTRHDLLRKPRIGARQAMAHLARDRLPSIRAPDCCARRAAIPVLPRQPTGLTPG